MSHSWLKVFICERRLEPASVYVNRFADDSAMRSADREEICQKRGANRLTRSTSNIARQGIWNKETDSVLHTLLRDVTDGRLSQRHEACRLQEYDTSFRDAFFRLYENALLAHIHHACTKTALGALAIEVAQDKLAVSRNTLIPPTAFGFGWLRGI